MNYRQPPLNRAVNPMKMNWLWRLTCEVGYVGVDDVLSALNEAGIRVSRERALGWFKSEGEDGYFPLTIAELEQNLRALQSVRSGSLHATLSGIAGK
ncbi:hypothetical protein [Dyella psychrodurans]|uniref:DUF1456 family protein n=1 Tax=Dyella psychrodurans TaxID=1927960 RepID=A0A370WY03_9GAMM|nr:hypothetical protein [Dyella psychrodurans]RDS80917.1 hypothetical protein DWU99_17805 [Dyella psychrodurans]